MGLTDTFPFDDIVLDRTDRTRNATNQAGDHNLFAETLNALKDEVLELEARPYLVAGPTGDAATDTANLAAALELAFPEGGTVVLSAGEYLIDEGFVFPSEDAGALNVNQTAVTVVGQGRGATKLTFSPSSPSALFTVGDDNTKTRAGDGFHDFQIVLGNTNALAGIHLIDPCRGVTISKVGFIGVGTGDGEGILLSGETSANSYHTISQCLFRNLETGIHFSGFANGNLVINCATASVTNGILADAVAGDTLGGNDNQVIRCEFDGSTAIAIKMRDGATRWLFENVKCDGATKDLDLDATAVRNTFIRCGFTYPSKVTLTGAARTTNTFIDCDLFHTAPGFWLGDVQVWRSSTREVTVDSGDLHATSRADWVVRGEVKAGLAFRLLDAAGAVQFSFQYGGVTSTSFSIDRQGGTNAFAIFSDDGIRIGKSGGKVGFYGGTTATQQAITGALSAVTDANAKAVLTSIIAALTGTNLVTNTTT